MLEYDVAFATGPAGEFGNESGLPWPRLPRDMEFFKDLSLKYDLIICGNNTYKTLPKSYKEGKKFLVLTSSLEGKENTDKVCYIKMPGEVVDLCMVSDLSWFSKHFPTKFKSLVIGGAKLLGSEGLIEGASRIYVTSVEGAELKATEFLDPRVMMLLKSFRISTLIKPKAEDIPGWFTEIREFV